MWKGEGKGVGGWWEAREGGYFVLRQRECLPGSFDSIAPEREKKNSFSLSLSIIHCDKGGGCLPDLRSNLHARP